MKSITKNITLEISNSAYQNNELPTEPAWLLVAKLIHDKFNALSFKEKLNAFNAYEKCKNGRGEIMPLREFSAMHEIENEAKEEAKEAATKNGYKSNNFFEGCRWFYAIKSN
jgi:protoporphyrinogen oxidase